MRALPPEGAAALSESMPAIEQYLRKIEGRHPMSKKARQALIDLPSGRQTYETYRDIVREGERTTRCCLIESGFASRYKTLPNGGRQINSFHFPSDMVDLQSSLLMVADHGVRTHAPTTIVTFDCQDILKLADDYPEWGRAFWFDTMVDSSIFREWTLNVGRRTAVSRVAHLLLEFAWRLKSIGESDGRKFTVPVTQSDLADAAGLSAVHTNRSLQRLREDGLIRSYGKTVVIEKPDELAKVASFDARYLHPEGPREPSFA
jgi:CRP-like cAMP-binding protein